MSNDEDWLQDPLMETSEGSYKYHKPKSLPKEQQDQWESFHFATRLKLEGADYFCRQVLGMASMPNTMGMPLLAYKQLKWFLDAFFFELMSAWDILLQELNIVYAHDLGLKPQDVRWTDRQKNKNKFMEKLPDEIINYIATERKKDWFRKIQSYRNTATHHSYPPGGSWRIGGDEPWNYTEHKITMFYFDHDTEEGKAENIDECREYLRKMIDYIHYVWGKMTGEFD